jgi:hypothetical protein
MTPGLIETLCEHAAGNYRVLCAICSELLAAACDRELKQLDEKLFLELTAAPPPRSARPPARESRR